MTTIETKIINRTEEELFRDLLARLTYLIIEENANNNQISAEAIRAERTLIERVSGITPPYYQLKKGTT